jgi:hypothetical protein
MVIYHSYVSLPEGTDCDYDYDDYYYYVSLYRIVFIDIMMLLAVRHPNL